MALNGDLELYGALPLSGAQSDEVRQVLRGQELACAYACL